MIFYTSRRVASLLVFNRQNPTSDPQFFFNLNKSEPEFIKFAGRLGARKPDRVVDRDFMTYGKNPGLT